MVSVSLQATQKVLDSVSSFEMNLYSNFITYILKTSTEPFHIWDNYVYAGGVAVVSMVSIALVMGLKSAIPMADLGL